MPTPAGKESVSSPVASTAATRQELPYRLRQQSLLGAFGRTALQTRDIGQILQRATELCAQGLETPFAKVLEYMPEEKRLLVSAGVGWAPDTIGQVSLGVDLESPAGYAFHTGQIVISNHLSGRNPLSNAETAVGARHQACHQRSDRAGRRRSSPVWRSGSRQRGLGSVRSCGCRYPCGFAGLLGIAIERQQADAELQKALEHQAILTREMSHRVKNSLASVVGLLRVQSRSAQSEEVQNALKDAASRITTIAQVHDHLWRSIRIGFVDTADFAGELLQEAAGNARLQD
jgi:hypothetical protein